MPFPIEKLLVLVPAYREERHVADLVREILDYAPNVLVVDDGSPDATAEAARSAGATVLAHAKNRGKGAALQSGFEYAAQNGFEFVLTMDGDGQHAPSDIPAFLAAWERTHAQVLVGNRMGDTAGMPWLRRRTNLFMSSLLSKVMGQYVPDTQCGFRLYQSSAFPEPPEPGSDRFAAESESLLRLSLRGVTISSVTIQTIYGEEKSKINPIADTIRFFRMLRRFKKIRREAERQL